MATDRVLRAIDVCCGAGGWAVAARGLPIRIEYAFDREMDCLLTYKDNFPQVECVQCDVTNFDFSELRGQVDLVLGGIPCEPISLARTHVQLGDMERQEFYKLIDKCIDIPRELEAPWYCFEDVVGLRRFVPPLTDHFIMDSKYFSGQRRRRAYFGNVPQPTKQANGKILKDYLRPGPYRVHPGIRKKQPDKKNVYCKEKFFAWYPSEKSPTVIGLSPRHDNYAAVQNGEGWRQLEWQELARLQGFPPEYVFVATHARAIKMVAQAVQIDTARAILERLCEEAD